MAPLRLAVVGLVMGLAQLVVIRGRIRSPGLWVLASVVGWAVLGPIVGGSLDRLADIAALGALPAALTGLALVALWRRAGG